MDRKTVEAVKSVVEKTTDRRELDVEKIIVFGSRARDDYRESSDVDLLIVSRDFEDVPWNKRPGPFYEEWDYDRLPAPEFICLTPEEFEDKRDRKPHIVNDAAQEGIEIA